ncbi:MAG: 6-bladed beta-propeller [Candidatus Doudnabacteria bacterium]
MPFLLAVFFALAILAPHKAFASSFTSAQDGNWNDGATWGNTSPGVIGVDFPGPTDDATIENNVTLTQDRSVHDITISDGGTLDLGTRVFSVSGNFTNNGTLNAGTSHVILTGSNQTILGNNNFYNLTKITTVADTLSFDPANTTTVTGTLTLTGVSTGLLTVNHSPSNGPVFDSRIGIDTFSVGGNFQSPTAIATDSLGNFYVADDSNNYIQKLDHSGNFITRWGGGGTDNGQFDSVTGITTTADASDVYVVDSGNNRIEKFDSSGNYISQWGSIGSGDGEFNQPSGITIDSSDDFLYVTDTNNNRIQKFDSAGNYISQWGSIGSGDGEFNQPLGIAIDSSDDLYVIDNGNYRVEKFDSAGTFLSTFGWGVQDGANHFEICTNLTTPCLAGITGDGLDQFSNPQVITVDQAGDIYVADWAGNNARIEKFHSDGSFFTEWESPPSGDSFFVFSPAGISTDSSGKVYVTDSNNYRVKIFDPSGNFLSIFGDNQAEGVINQAGGIRADASGNFYVADSFSDRIQKFDPSGHFLFTFGWGVQDGANQFEICTSGCQVGLAGSGDGQFNLPQGITTDTLGNIYVSDAGNLNSRIEKFDSGGHFLSTFGWGVQDGANQFEICTSGCQGGIVGSGDGQFNNSQAMVFDSFGNLYVADNGNTRIEKFGPSGNFVTKWGSPGTSESEFSGLNSVAVDSSNNVYVPDNFNNRIQKFDSSGTFLSTFGWGVQTGANMWESCTSNCQAGIAGMGDGELNGPQGIAIDSSGNLYVSDSQSSRIQKLDPAGHFLLTFGWGVLDGANHFETCFSGCQGGINGFAGDGQFSEPGIIAVDPLNNIYVYTQKFTTSADTWNLNSSGSSALSYLSVSSSHSASAVTCTNCTDEGGNINWNFVTVLVPSSFTSVQDGNWNDGATWGNTSPGIAGIDYPTYLDSATINNEVTLTNDQSIDDITISDGGALHLGTNTFNISGNLTNNGELHADTSTVILTGTNQTILGSNTFYNLTKITTIADTLSFDPANTTTVTGTLTLTGVSTGLLTLNHAPGTGQPVFASKFGIGSNTVDGNFSQITGIAHDSSGNIYAVDVNNNRIQKFDPSGNFIIKWGSFGTGDGQFDAPGGIIVDSSNNIYIVDTNRVQEFTSAGTFIKTFGWGVLDGTPAFQVCNSNCQAGIAGSGPGQFDGSGGISVAADSSGNVYISDAGNNRIQKFGPDGHFISAWGSFGSGDGQLKHPYYIAIDSSDNIYVADNDNSRIQKFNTSGAFQSTFGWGVQTGANAFQTCTSGCQAGISGPGAGQFNASGGITTDSSDNIYVADYGNSRIQVFGSNGAFQSTFGWGVLDGTEEFQICTSGCQAGIPADDPDVPGGEGQTSLPVGVTVDASGNIYVADSGIRIEKFDPSENFLSKFGNSSPEGELNNPIGIANDSSGNIYVVDQGNSRIQKFDPSGNFLSTFGWGVQTGADQFEICTSGCQTGIGGSGDGQFLVPGGIAIDSSNNIYVTDSSNHRIEVFNSGEGFVTQWGTEGSGDGQFEYPQGIVFDSSGNIYVVDASNNRIQKFDPDGAFLSTFGWGVQDGTTNAFQICTSGCQGGIRGSDAGQFNEPAFLAIDSFNNIYVTDSDNSRIQKFSLNTGEPVFEYTIGWGVQDGADQFEICTSGCQAGSEGGGYGQFIDPQGIAIDSSNNIYVANIQNNRIEKFDPSGNLLLTFGWGVQDGTTNAFQICTSGCQSGIPGSGDGQFAVPLGITMDHSGNIYVADANNGRIQKFTTGSSAWNLDSQGSSVLSYLSVSSSHATSVVTCTNCIDGGGNINWNFGGSTPPPPPPPPPSGGGGPTCCAPYVPPGTNQQASNTLTSDGSLLLDHGVIYVMSQGFKRPFVSMAVFTALGYKLSNVIRADTSAIPEGESILSSNIRHPVGALILNQGTVYLLGTDLRYGFPSEAVFYSYGYQFKDVLPANSLDLLLPQGPIVQMNNSGQVPSFPSTGGDIKE